MVYFLIAVILIIALIFLVFIITIRSIQPNNPAISVNQLKSFLGFNLTDDYTIIEHFSRNNHPDKPMNVCISLPTEAFEKVTKYLADTDLIENVTYSEDKQIKYTVRWTKKEHSFYKTHTISYTNPDYQFFFASLDIDCINRTLTYNEYGS